jgi:hypothetical protein
MHGQNAVLVLNLLFLALGVFIGWLFTYRHGERIPDAIEYDSREGFEAWQAATMMRAVVANATLCDDGFGVSHDPQRIRALAEQVLEKALEGGVWCHAAEARATDGTIAWAARWIGLLPSVNVRPDDGKFYMSRQADPTDWSVPGTSEASLQRAEEMAWHVPDHHATRRKGFSPGLELTPTDLRRIEEAQAGELVIVGGAAPDLLDRIARENDELARLGGVALSHPAVAVDLDKAFNQFGPITQPDDLKE